MSSSTSRSLHRFANPGQFLRLSDAVLPWLVVGGILLTGIGLVWGVAFVPDDAVQGNTVKIMYVHVPAAWLAESGYAGLALCSFLSIVWRHPLADLAAAEISAVGAGFAALCLATGSLWGKPEWGAWWVWDLRLTSMLILLFLYLGHIAIVRAFDDPARGYRAGAVLALVGAVDLPIIKFCVEKWNLLGMEWGGNTLHQPASIGLTTQPTIHTSMLWPLLIAAIGYTLCFAAIVTARTQAAVMERRIRGLLMVRASSESQA